MKHKLKWHTLSPLFKKAKEELHLDEVDFLLISEDMTEDLEGGVKLINIKEWSLF